jgi:hypothetical protein
LTEAARGGETDAAGSAGDDCDAWLDGHNAVSSNR